MSTTQRWLVLATVSAGLLMVSVDTTVLYTALPTLTRSLQADAQQKLWILNALSAGDSRPAARRGHARRPHRPQADVPDRPGPVRSRLPPGRVRPIPAGADRRPGLPRGRRSGDAARHLGTDPHHLRRRT